MRCILLLLLIFFLTAHKDSLNYGTMSRDSIVHPSLRVERFGCNVCQVVCNNVVFTVAIPYSFQRGTVYDLLCVPDDVFLDSFIDRFRV